MIWTNLSIFYLAKTHKQGIMEIVVYHYDLYAGDTTRSSFTCASFINYMYEISKKIQTIMKIAIGGFFNSYMAQICLYYIQEEEQIFCGSNARSLIHSISCVW